MSVKAVNGLREVLVLVESFDGPSAIHRAAELEAAERQVAAYADELLEVTESTEVQRLLAGAVKALQVARKAGHTHQRTPLTRPVSQARFALKLGSAAGGLRLALEELDPDHPLPPPPFGKDSR
ncbi:hypothetical protein RM844_08675 [Streptomyces sp. DSM 44915]|uniref:Uncharacterized protein n=1 Tax=Streptomyces chisholmiae TaxID=3075540 RepID=A0ABU2JNR9_9ACTN|nr:hypothetical protein [Streptomyces sp. DSM 44915]MDT0266368.1 hypothetical protein [Streptomyces sp. DSM 44915]